MKKILPALLVIASLMIPSEAMAAYIVKAGDTLYDIGQRHGNSVEELMAMNPSIVHPDLIEVGDELSVGTSTELLIREKVWPVHKGYVTSHYGRRNGRLHGGLDIAAPLGAWIHATDSGVVDYVGWDDGYGNFFDIKHTDGTMSRYAHCRNIMVEEGEVVEHNQIVATVGSTGRSSGPHLHFEIHIPDWGTDNPLIYLP